MLTTILIVLGVLAVLALAWFIVPVVLGLLPFALFGWAVWANEYVVLPLAAVILAVLGGLAIAHWAERAARAILSWIYKDGARDD